MLNNICKCTPLYKIKIKFKPNIVYMATCIMNQTIIHPFNVPNGYKKASITFMTEKGHSTCCELGKYAMNKFIAKTFKSFPNAKTNCRKSE